jgi:hypothetical protein
MASVVDNLSQRYPNIKSYYLRNAESTDNNPKKMIYCPENHSESAIRFNKDIYLNTYLNTYSSKSIKLTFDTSVQSTLQNYSIDYNYAYSQKTAAS